jgi:hypothetical protein
MSLAGLLEPENENENFSGWSHDDKVTHFLSLGKLILKEEWDRVKSETEGAQTIESRELTGAAA